MNVVIPFAGVCLVVLMALGIISAIRTFDEDDKP